MCGYRPINKRPTKAKKQIAVTTSTKGTTAYAKAMKPLRKQAEGINEIPPLRVVKNEIKNVGELTVEKLRTYKKYENISEAEAKEKIKAIETFARILYNLSKNENKSHEHDL